MTRRNCELLLKIDIMTGVTSAYQIGGLLEKVSSSFVQNLVFKFTAQELL